MRALLVAHVAATSAYAGFQWLVQVVVYRMFAAVGAERFPAYETEHQRRITRVVAPLFGALLVTTGGLFLVDGVPLAAAVAAAALLAALFGLTGLGAVPRHRRLTSAYDAATHRELLRVDLARCLVATANAALAVWLAVTARG